MQREFAVGTDPFSEWVPKRDRDAEIFKRSWRVYIPRK